MSPRPRVSGVYPPGVLDVLEGNTQFCVCQMDALDLLAELPPESIDRFIGAELVGTYLERAENALKAAA